jgi:hypothetical protein
MCAQASPAEIPPAVAAKEGPQIPVVRGKTINGEAGGASDVEAGTVEETEKENRGIAANLRFGPEFITSQAMITIPIAVVKLIFGISTYFLEIDESSHRADAT